ncbi:hypothetical protein CEXT_57761 [Caerostris extrusa]|uniref:Uncharacterized protein n=1 Tax=Caerostris extrusa TaxID=172846 RepID=A0AAV4XJS2_CAEEX|nr:hypothetical protein CEXT_57761 [Caerostris extrusa]
MRKLPTCDNNTFRNFRSPRRFLHCVTDRTTIGRESSSVSRYHSNSYSHHSIPIPHLHYSTLFLFPFLFFFLFFVVNPEAAEAQHPSLQHQPPQQDHPGDESEYESEGEGDLSDDHTMNQHHLSDTQEQEAIIARIKHRQEMEDRYRMAMRDELRYSPDPNRAGNGNSKSGTPSPDTSGQQYLYAANHPFNATFFNPSHMAAAQAAVAMAAGRHLTPAPLSGGSSSHGSETPPNNGIGGAASPKGAAGETDQSKYTFEEQFKQHRPYASLNSRDYVHLQDGTNKLHELLQPNVKLNKAEKASIFLSSRVIFGQKERN